MPQTGGAGNANDWVTQGNMGVGTDAPVRRIHTFGTENAFRFERSSGIFGVSQSRSGH